MIGMYKEKLYLLQNNLKYILFSTLIFTVVMASASAFKNVYNFVQICILFVAVVSCVSTKEANKTFIYHKILPVSQLDIQKGFYLQQLTINICCAVVCALLSIVFKISNPLDELITSLGFMLIVTGILLMTFSFSSGFLSKVLSVLIGGFFIVLYNAHEQYFVQLSSVIRLSYVYFVVGCIVYIGTMIFSSLMLEKQKY